MKSTRAVFKPSNYVRDTMSSTVRAFLSSPAMQDMVDAIAREYPIDSLDDFVSAKNHERFLRQWLMAEWAVTDEASKHVSWDVVVQNIMLPKPTIAVISSVPARRFATDVLTSAYEGEASHLIKRMRDAVQDVPCYNDGLKNDSWGYFLSEMHSAIRADALKNPSGLRLRQVIAQNVDWKALVARQDDRITVPLVIQDQRMSVDLRAMDFLESDPRKDIEIRIDDDLGSEPLCARFKTHELRQHIYGFYQAHVDKKQENDVPQRDGVMRNVDPSMIFQADISMGPSL